MSQQDLNYFRRIPWCAALLNDPQHTVEPTGSRAIKADGEDALFGGTLKSSNTISACVTFYRTPAEGRRITEVYALVALERGLDGYPSVCHGGIVALLLDEVFGVLHSVNKTLSAKLANESGKPPPERPATVTAKLEVNYVKPVKTPQTVLLTATLVKTEGRKMWIEGSIKDKDGTVLSTGEALFIRMSKAKL